MTEIGVVVDGELPKGWRRARLADVARIVGGSTPSSATAEYWGGNIVWVTPTDLSALNGPDIFSSTRRITSAGYESCAVEILPVGSVVMSSRAPIGYLGIAKTELTTNQGCKSFVPDLDQITPEFLYEALVHEMPEIIALGAGSTFAEVSKSKLEGVTIPLPPLEEQRRLVSALTKLRLTNMKLEGEARLQLREVGWIGRRVTTRAIGPGVRLRGEAAEAPEGWAWRSLTDVARLESGHTPSRRRPDWWGGDIPWLALPDIRRLHGRTANDTAEHTNERGLANSSARLLPAGTVCLSRTASVGFATLLGRPMATSQDFVNWICGPELDPHFLLAALVESGDYLRSIAEGAIHKTIYVPAVKSLQICMPPIEQQHAAVEALDSAREHMRRIAEPLREQIIACKDLDSALLRAAFSGNL